MFVWLGIGFVINLALTAFLALYCPQFVFNRSIGPASGWWVVAPRGTASPQVEMVDRAWGQTDFVVHRYDDKDAEAVVWYLMRCRVDGYLTDAPNEVATGRRVGWPMRSLAEHFSTFGVVRRGEPVSVWDRIVWAWERGVPTGFGRRRSLPIRPVWGGLIVNSAFYGALAWGVVCGPGIVRRRWRAAKGRCLACGYDLTGQDRCPECGHDR